MIIFHDPQCADYGATAQYEQPARAGTTVAFLRAKHLDWQWRLPPIADEAVLQLVHSPQHLERLQYAADFDEDTPYFEGIYTHARRSVGAALAAMAAALDESQKAFALMRPPGHHALPSQAMGFCYLNQIAITALAAQKRGIARVAIWDFDAHHGNGTEDILHDHEGILFVDVHEDPAYPHTGKVTSGNCRNYCVAPHSTREEHMAALRRSWSEVLAFRPELVLVSAGFDAYARDPITKMSLEAEDFAELGRWLSAAQIPTAAFLEGGYSPDLPQLVDSFLTTWGM
jgi:acetoin utilization deacetylase AcuC-like enzyme